MGLGKQSLGSGAVQLAGESLTCSSDSLTVFVVVVALSFVCFVFLSKDFSVHAFYKDTGESSNAVCTACNPGPPVCTSHCIWTCDNRTFHLTFIVYSDPCIILKIKKHPHLFLAMI